MVLGRVLSIATVLLVSVLMIQQLIASASGTAPIEAVRVVVDAARDEISVSVHIRDDDPALQGRVSGALLELLDELPGSFGLSRNGSGVFVSVSIKGVLKYITSDEELFINYMNYAIPSNASRTCLQALGRTGFDLGLLIPKGLREIIDSVGADSVVFEVVSPFLNESALEEVADTVAQHIPGQVTASRNALIITLGNASGHACVPYEPWFWRLFGVPRAVATIPLYPPDQYETYHLILLQIEVGRIPLKNVTAVYTPPPGLIPRCAGGWGTILCYSNETSVSFSTTFSTDHFTAQANLELMRPGVYELGKVRLTYCLPPPGPCTNAEIPVYSFQTEGTTITVKENQCFSGAGFWWISGGALPTMVATAAITAATAAAIIALKGRGKRGRLR